jgi:hypothetical protein
MKASDYRFQGSYPTAATVRKAYDDADLVRAIQAYKFFYPTVSIGATWEGNADAGLIANKMWMLLLGNPHQTVLTPNSDTPYTGANIDLGIGPFVVEMPAGAVMSVVNDMNQRYVMDLGLPGPDAGKGGKHLIVPPGYTGAIPPGYFVGHSTTNRVLLLVRAIPPEGDDEAAIAKLKSVKAYPLNRPAGWPEMKWLAIGERPGKFTPFDYEQGIGYWKRLHEMIDREPPFEAYRMNYGELAVLGIEKGKPFKPDARMKRILEKAAKLANAQMRVQSFADRTPERRAWRDRQWEWASLRSENGIFDLPARKDLIAREKWFYQAAIESPAMFRRDANAGSLYWLGTRDKSGKYLDGAKTYRLRVPLPVPARLFWSVTAYDAATRSELRTRQMKAALRSMHELAHVAGSAVDLYFGPKAPKGAEDRWIRTEPRKGWFVYFRIYGPDKPAFDGSWKPGDFEKIR